MTTLSLTEANYSLDAVFAAYAAVLNSGIANIVACPEAVFVVLKDDRVLELDIPNATAMTQALVHIGFADLGALIAAALAMVMVEGQDEPVENTPRFVAEINAIGTDGQKASTVCQIDEIDELADIIEKGPTWGPGYTAEIKLSYAL